MITPKNYARESYITGQVSQFRYPISYVQIALNGTTTATKLTSIPATATSALITVVVTTGTIASTNVAFRIREDGTAPTTTSGMPLAHLDTFEISGNDSLNLFQIVCTASYTAAEVNVTYYH